MSNNRWNWSDRWTTDHGPYQRGHVFIAQNRYTYDSGLDQFDCPFRPSWSFKLCQNTAHILQYIDEYISAEEFHTLQCQLNVKIYDGDQNGYHILMKAVKVLNVKLVHFILHVLLESNIKHGQQLINLRKNDGFGVLDELFSNRDDKQAEIDKVYKELEPFLLTVYDGIGDTSSVHVQRHHRQIARRVWIPLYQKMSTYPCFEPQVLGYLLSFILKFECFA